MPDEGNLWPQTYAVRLSPISKQIAAAQEAAARRGVELPYDAAEEVAKAVLECADDEHRVTMLVTREFDENPAALSAARRRNQDQLARDLAAMKVLPVALPREVIVRSRSPWEPTQVQLVAPFRNPATSR